MTGAMVYCVLCIDGEGGETTHIFSSPKKAQEFSASDDRSHVVFDYVVDHPERMEEVMQ